MQLPKYHMRIADRGEREFYKLATRPERGGGGGRVVMQTQNIPRVVSRVR